MVRGARIVGAVLAGVLSLTCAACEAPPGPTSAGSSSAQPAEPLPTPPLLAEPSPAQPQQTAAGPVDGTAPAASPSAATAWAAALQLTFKGRAPKTGYSRDQFGTAWKDTDRNGCDQRNDVLGRDLTDRVYKAGTGGCVVLSGTLADPYSGRDIAFVRGVATSSAVQIDHVVALSDAWQKGAQQWPAATREAFANDPANLLAVDGPLNTQKSDGDAATWLPPNRAYRCPYVARQVEVKLTYGLWVTAAEQAAMVAVLAGCPQEPLPTGAAPAPVPAAPAHAPAPAPAAAPAPVPPAAVPPAPAPADVYFASCAAARAAGAAPVLRGQPGYSGRLDRDNDGIGCE